MIPRSIERIQLLLRCPIRVSVPARKRWIFALWRQNTSPAMTTSTGVTTGGSLNAHALTGVTAMAHSDDADE